MINFLLLLFIILNALDVLCNKGNILRYAKRVADYSNKATSDHYIDV
jgi:hypothetical protein